METFSIPRIATFFCYSTVHNIFTVSGVKFVSYLIRFASDSPNFFASDIAIVYSSLLLVRKHKSAIHPHTLASAGFCKFAS